VDEAVTARSPQLIAVIRQHPAVFIAIVVSAVMLIGRVGVSILSDSIGNDFGVYWRTANGSLTAVYSAGFEYPFPYAPTMLLWIAPLRMVAMWPAFIFWVCISVVAILWASRTYLTRKELWLLSLCPPVTSCIVTGQVSAVLAAMMLWSFATKNRLSAGIALGAVATIKPQLVLFAPLLLLLRSDWRALWGSAATFALLILLSIILFGARLWPEWISSMDNFRSVLSIEAVINAGMSPATAAERWGLPPLPFILFGVVAGGWLICRSRAFGPLESTAAVATASLLAAPYGLIYDLTALSPFLICSVFKRRVTSALAISTAASPLPLVLAGYELARFSRKSARDHLESTSDPVG